MGYFLKVAEKKIFRNDRGFVELWDITNANTNEESRIETITIIASLSYGNEYAKNPQKLYQLLKEKKHLSVFEFIRCYPFFDIPTSFRHKPNCRYISDYDFSQKINIISDYRKNVGIVKIKVPIFVMRQIVRHRGFSFLEISRRFVNPEKVPFEFWYPEDLDDKKKLDFNLAFMSLYEQMRQYTNKLEIARTVLPLNLYTTVWVLGHKEAWDNFFKLRLTKETQQETRIVAENMYELFKQEQPLLVR